MDQDQVLGLAGQLLLIGISPVVFLRDRNWPFQIAKSQVLHMLNTLSLYKVLSKKKKIEK